MICNFKVLILMILFSINATATSNTPSTFTYQGRIIDSGVPVTGTLEVYFEIYNPAKTCLLRSENHTITTTDGTFSIQVGDLGGATAGQLTTGTPHGVADDPTFGPIEDVFANNKTYSCGYVAGATDARVLSLKVWNGSSLINIADQTLTPVPQAWIANNSEKLSGKIINNFSLTWTTGTKAAVYSGLSGTVVGFNTTTNILESYDGTTTTPLTPAFTSAAITGAGVTAGDQLRWNGTQWEPFTYTESGDINGGTNLGAGAAVFAQKNADKLEFRTLESSDNLLTVTQNANTIDLTLNAAAVLPLDQIDGGANGQILRHNGSEWAAYSGTAPNQVLRWDNAGSEWVAGDANDIGAIDGSGTALTLPMFTASQTIGDSKVSQNAGGTVVTIDAGTMINGGLTVVNGVDVNNEIIANVLDPVANKDAANKEYVDTQIAAELGGTIDDGTVTGQTLKWDDTAGKWIVSVNDVFIDGTNVGIGTVTTNEKLTVEGNLSLRKGAAPTNTANYGKLFVDTADSRAKFVEDGAATVNTLAYVSEITALTDVDAGSITGQLLRWNQVASKWEVFTLNDQEILVGNGSNIATAVTVSQDVDLANTGAATVLGFNTKPLQVGAASADGQLYYYDADQDKFVLVDVTGIADGEVLTWNNTTKVWEPASVTAGGGVLTTATNVGVGGTGVLDAINGTTIELRNINAGSNKIDVALDAANKEVDIDVNEANLTLSNVGGTLNPNQITDGTVNGQILNYNAVSSEWELSTAAGATDNQIMRYDFATKKWTPTSGLEIDSSGNALFAGTVTLDTDPTANLEATTKQYVDAAVSALPDFSNGTVDGQIMVWDDDDNAWEPVAASQDIAVTDLGVFTVRAIRGKAITTTLPAVNGQIYYYNADANAGAGEWQLADMTGLADGYILKWDNTAKIWEVGPDAGAAGTIVSVNGETGSAQTLNTALISDGSVTGPTIDSATVNDTHTFKFPMANNAGTTGGGLITKAEFDTFNAKQVAITDGTNTSHYLKWDGDSWEPAYVSTLVAPDGAPNPAFSVDNAGEAFFPVGASINEFSIDGTMAGNSDDAVPTEKAVKTYVDTEVAGAIDASELLGKDGVTITDNAGTLEFDADVDDATIGLTGVSPNKKLYVKNDGITATQLATDAVETLKIKDKNVTRAKLQDGATAGQFMWWDGDSWELIDMTGVADNEVLKFDTDTNTWYFDTDAGSAGLGEVNTASNYGVGGVGLYNDKNSADLRFRNINVGSNKLSVTLDAPNREVDLDVNEANLTLSNIGGSVNPAQILDGTHDGQVLNFNSVSGAWELSQATTAANNTIMKFNDTTHKWEPAVTFTTDNTLGGGTPSDAKVSSELAVKTYVDTLVGAIPDLEDGVSDGQVLVWDQTTDQRWEARTVSGDTTIDAAGATTLNKIKGKAITGAAAAANGQIYYYNADALAGAGEWQLADMTGLVDGSVLKWDATAKIWEVGADAGASGTVASIEGVGGTVDLQTTITSGVDVGPTWSVPSGSNINLNIPLASNAATTGGGLITKAQYDTFNAKQAALTVGTDTSHYLKWDGDSWEPAFVSSLVAPDGAPNPAFSVDNAGEASFPVGASINEFSIDGTMAGNSDDAIPTEKAVVTYVAAVTSTLVDASDIDGQDGITVTDNAGVIEIDADTDGTTLELSAADGTGKIRVKDDGISAAKLATDAVETLKIKDKNVTLAKIADGTANGQIAQWDATNSVWRYADVTGLANGKILKWDAACNTAAGCWKVGDDAGAAGTVASLQGLTGTLDFAISTAGTAAPSWDTADSDTVRLNIPEARIGAAGGVLGLISKTDYDRIPASGTGTNNTLRWNGTAWVETTGLTIEADGDVVLANAPTADVHAATKLYVDTATSGLVSDVTGGDGITATDTAGVIDIDANVDGTTLEINTDAIRIKDKGVSLAKLADGATKGQVMQWSGTAWQLSNAAVPTDGQALVWDVTLNAGNGGWKAATPAAETDPAVAAGTQHKLSKYTDAGGTVLGDSNISENGTSVTISTAGLYLNYQPNATECADGGVLKWVAASDRWECGTDAGASGTVATVEGVAGTVDMQTTVTSGVDAGPTWSVPSGSNVNLNIPLASNAATTTGGLLTKTQYDRIPAAGTGTNNTLRWNGTGWVETTGLTIEADGDVVLANAPSADAHASTKLYVDTQVGGLQDATLSEGKVWVGDAGNLASETTLTGGQILVGNATSKATATSVTGDATLSNAGLVTVTALRGKAIDSDTLPTANGHLYYWSEDNSEWRVTAAPATNGHVLTWDNTAKTWGPAAPAGGIDGSGTLNYLPKFTPDGTTLGDSSIIDDATDVTFANPIVMNNPKLYYRINAVDELFMHATDTDTAASANTFVGKQAGAANTTGGNNTAIGSTAGASVTTAASVTAVGAGALRYPTAQNNTAVGFESQLGASGLSGGINNTSLGYNSMKAIRGGNFNVALGSSAMSGVTSGSANVAIGYLSLGSATTQGSQVAIGYAALLKSVGTDNVAIGYGSQSGDPIAGAPVTTAGSGNVSLGNGTLFYNDTGDYNTVVGSGGLIANVSGDNNTVLGYQAGGTLVSGSGNLFLGYQAGVAETGSNKLYIDNSNTATPLIYGDFSTNDLTINGGLTIATSGEYLNYQPNATECADGGVLKWTAATDRWECGSDDVGAAGGVSSLNGLDGGTVNLAFGTTGTAPNIATADGGGTDTLTLHIPMASTAAVTAGLLSKADYDRIPAAGTGANNTLRWNGTGWVETTGLTIEADGDVVLANAPSANGHAATKLYVDTAVGGLISDVTGGDGITATDTAGVIDIDANVDGTTLEINTDAIRIKDKGVSLAKLADGATKGQVMQWSGTAWQLSNAVAPTDGQALVWDATLNAGNGGWKAATPATGGITTIDGSSGTSLTVTDDTNVTVAGGVGNLTIGWTGQLGLTRGGTNKNMTAVNGGVIYSDADSMEVSAAGTSGQVLKSNGAAAPTWVDASTLETDPEVGANTTNRLSKWNGTALVTSLVGEDGTNMTLASGQISAPLGAVGAPTYSFTGDLNTGMYSSAADTVNIATNGVSRLSASNTAVTIATTGVYLNYQPNATECADGGVLKWTAATDRWECGSDDVGAAGGVSSLNGLDGGTVNLAFGTTGTAPNIATADGGGTDTLTLHIPMASTVGTTAGLLSKTDYDRLPATGTINRVARYTGTDAVGSSSILQDDGANLSLLSGQGFFPLGAVATPSYSFTGDANTGIYSTGADTLDFATAGTKRLTISSTGSIIAGAGHAVSSGDTLTDKDYVDTAVTGLVSDVTGGDGITATDTAGVIDIDANVDGTTLEINTDAIRIKDKGVSLAKLADGATKGQVMQWSGTAWQLSNAVAPTDGQALVWDATLNAGNGGWKAATPATGGITTIDGSSGTSLTVTNDTNIGITGSAGDLAINWIGQLDLSRGGTNKNMTAVNGGVIYSDADSMEVTAAGTSGQVLISNGAAAPTWVNASTLTVTEVDPEVGANTLNRLSKWNGTALVTSLVGEDGTNMTLASGQISAPLGAVATPTYSFTGDLNTGMYSSAADTLNFATAGASRLQLNSSAVTIATTGLYLNYQPNATECADGGVLKWTAATDRWECGTDAGASGTVATVEGVAGTVDLQTTVSSGTDAGPTWSVPSGSNINLNIPLASNAATTTGGLITKTDYDRLPAAGTINRVARYTSASATGASSILQDDGTNITALGTARFYTTTLGAVGTPAFSIAGDPNTGMWSAAADTLNFSTGGINRLTLSSAGVDVNSQVISSVSAPVAGGDATNKTYVDNAVASAVGDYVLKVGDTMSGDLNIGANLILNSGTSLISNDDGTSADPSYSFTNSLSTGMYYAGSHTLGFTARGTGGMTLSQTELFIEKDVRLDAKSLTTGGGNITTNGGTINTVGGDIVTTAGHIYTNGGNLYTAGGSVDLATGYLTGVGLGSFGAPSISFNADPNTGIYSSAADTLNFTTGGASRLQISSSAVTMATAGLYFNYQPNASECADGGVLKWTAATDRWECGTDSTGSGGITGIISAGGTSDTSTVTLGVPGTAGTAPNWTFTNGTPDTQVLNIPMASTAAVTAGLLSKTDYDRLPAAGTINRVARYSSASATGASSILQDDGTNITALGTARFYTTTLGAVGTPAFSIAGDPNTGMWSAAADTLNFATGGVNRLTLSSAGFDVNSQVVSNVSAPVAGGDATNKTYVDAAAGSGLAGSGTQYAIPRWTDTDTLGDSPITTNAAGTTTTFNAPLYMATNKQILADPQDGIGFNGEPTTQITNGGGGEMDFRVMGTSRIFLDSGIYMTGNVTVSSGYIYTDLGAVGTPSYSFQGDTNTGMYSSAADTLNFATAGVSRLQLTSTGAALMPGIVTGSEPATSGASNGSIYYNSTDQRFKVSMNNAAYVNLATTTGSGAVVDGTGTANRVMKWSDSDTATNSLLSDDGTNITLTSGQTLWPLGNVSTPSYSFTGDPNTGMYSSAADTLNLVTAGTSRFAIGSSGQLTGTTLDVNVASPYETSVGYQAGNSNSGDLSSFFGYQAGITNSTASYVTAVGGYALRYSQNGHRNTAIGTEALSGASTYTASYDNTAVGYKANYGISSSKSSNTAIGSYAMQSATGSENTAVGMNSLDSTTGNSNTAIGTYAGYYATGASATNVFVGYFSGPSSSSTVSNKLYIDNAANGASSLIYGDFSANTVTINGDAYATAYYYTSDERLKKNVQTYSNALSQVEKLRGVSFNWKSDNKADIGFIAQEVEKIIPELVSEKEDGMKTVKYANIAAILVEATKELHNMTKMSAKQIAELDARLKIVERKVAAVESKNSDQDKKIEMLEAELKLKDAKLKALESDISEIKKMLKQRK